MSLWWLQPGWKDAICQCGANIWESGGDPDHGVCYDCFQGRHSGTQASVPQCEVCGQHDSVASAAGRGVCSQECYDAVMREVHQ